MNVQTDSPRPCATAHGTWGVLFDGIPILIHQINPMYDTRRLFFGLLLGLFLVRGLPARAELASSTVVISEIAWAGSARSTADEWIELANVGSSSIDIGGWFLTGVGSNDAAIVLAEGTTIAPGGVLIIANYALGNEKTTLAVSPHLVTTAISIPNTKLDVVLAMPDGLVVDEIHDAGSPDFGDSTAFATMERSISDRSWSTASISVNLLDSQFGSPGVVQTVVVDVVNPSSTEDGIEPAADAPPDNTPLEATPAVNDDPLATADPIVDEPTPLDTTVPDAIVEEIPAEIVPDVSIDEAIVNESDVTVVADEIAAEAVADPVAEPIVEPAVEPTLEQPPDTAIEATAPVIDAPTEEPMAAEEPEPAVYAIDLPVDETPAATTAAPSVPAVEEPMCTLGTGDVRINEIMSSPASGATEWIELYNPTSAEIRLNGCALVDASGARTAIEGGVAPNAFALVSSPKGKLNNNGDTVTFLNTNGSAIDIVAYGVPQLAAPKRNQSIGVDADGVWRATGQPTPEAANAFAEVATPLPISPIVYEPATPSVAPASETVTPNDSATYRKADGTMAASAAATADRIGYVAAPTSVIASTTSKSVSTKRSTGSAAPRRVSAEAVAELADGDVVIVSGTLVALPGTFGNQIAYLNGLELYFHDAAWPALAVGDTLNIRGAVSTAHGNRRVKIASADDIDVIGSSEVVAQSLTNTPDEAVLHGTLVKLGGTADGRDGNTLLVIVGSSSMRIGIQNGGAIPPGAAGVTVTGVLRRDNGSVSIDLRSAADIVFDETMPSAAATVASGGKTPWGGIALVAGTLGLLGTSFMLAKRKLTYSSPLISTTV